MVSGGWKLFRKPRRADLGPAHAVLVDQLRVLIERYGEPLDVLGEAVRHRLGQPVPARAGQRISELGMGSRFPAGAPGPGRPDELTAIVAVCTGDAPAQVGRFARLRATAVAEREATRRAALLDAPPTAESLDTAGGAGRVGDGRDWVRLGVHEPITRLADGTDLTDRVKDGHLPAYVLREVDRLQLRPALHSAAAGQGPAARLVVVVGESTAGKTRMAAEAARAELGDWELVVPRAAGDLEALLAAPGSAARVLVWLDEVQDLLAQPGAVEAVQKMLNLPAGPVVLLATVRTDAERALEGSAGWRLLDQAHRVELYRRPPDPSELQRELDRAAELDDPWICEALAKLDGKYGIAEWLAAGPQLLRELGRARTSGDPVQRVAAAVVDAAVDCYRAGYTIPIAEPLLIAAHRLYLSGADQVDPTLEDPDLFPAALVWARRRVAGAVGLLVHDRGRGDRAFDYLLGHADRPDGDAVKVGLWPVLLRLLTRATSTSVALAAARRGQHAVAGEIARRNPYDVDLMFDIGDVTGLTRLSDHGDWYARERLAELLAQRKDLDALTRRADHGDQHAAQQLAELLAQQEDLDALTCRVDIGDQHAAEQLARLLAKRGDLDALTRRADDGDHAAAQQLVWLLAKRRDLDALTRRADDGDQHAAEQLVRLLVKRGDLDALARRADHGDQDAAERLAWLLVKRGDLDALARRADHGDQDAAERLAWLLVKQGNLDALTRRADHGDQHAARRLAVLLAERGDLDALTRRADHGDQDAAQQLVELLLQRGSLDALTRRAEQGDQHAARRLAVLLAERGDLDALTRLADHGDLEAALRLAVLAQRVGRGQG